MIYYYAILYIRRCYKDGRNKNIRGLQDAKTIGRTVWRDKPEDPHLKDCHNSGAGRRILSEDNREQYFQ